MDTQGLTREQFGELLQSSAAQALIPHWLEAVISDWAALSQLQQQIFLMQAERFLGLLAQGLHSSTRSERIPPETDTALQVQFPQVYSISSLQALEQTLMSLPELSASGYCDTAGLLPLLLQALAGITPEPTPAMQPTTRLAHLYDLAWRFNSLLDENAILKHALTEASALVQADASALWLWDADQQAPVMMMTPEDQNTEFPLPEAFLARLREVSTGTSVTVIGPEDSDDSWHSSLVHRTVALLPIRLPDQCVGIISVSQHEERSFTHDDLLFLSFLGNLVSTALSHARRDAGEHYLIELLQASIRQVVQATSGRIDTYEEFVYSLLQMAEGLARADGVCALVSLEEHLEPTCVMTGALTGRSGDDVRQITELLRERLPQHPPATGLVRELAPSELQEKLRGYVYAQIELPLSSKATGIMVALKATPFSDDQLAFLRSVSEEIGVGINNMLQSANVERLLYELSNVNYVAAAISGTLDKQRIFAFANQAASHALAVPVMLSGLWESDDSISIPSDTSIGITQAVERGLRLTRNQAAFRRALETRKAVTSDMPGVKLPCALSHLAGSDAQSWACIPLVAQNRALGIMLAVDNRPRIFTTHELALLSTYANQAALAISNSLLYEQVEHQLQQMQVLYNFSHALTAARTVHDIGSALMRATMDALAGDAALMTLTNPATGLQRAAQLAGLHDQHFIGNEFKQQTSAVVVSSQRDTAEVSINLPADGRSPLLRELAQSEGMVSSLTVPIRDLSGGLGTLTIFTREVREFSESAQNLARKLAGDAATALRNLERHNPERQMRQLSDHLCARVPDAITTLQELLASVPQGSAEVAWIRHGLESIAAVQAGVSLDQPLDIGMKAVAMSLFEESRDALPPGSQLRVEGAAVSLPFPKAVAATLFIREWLAAMAATAGSQPIQAVVTFQLAHQAVLMQIDDDVNWGGKPAPVNQAVVDLALRRLRGTMEEQHDGRHLVRVQFRLAAK